MRERDMTTKLDPLIYVHETKEEAEAYDAWFRKKVQEGLDDIERGDTVPHAEVMSEIDQIIREAEERQKR
jgi:predicted transcriptional regulator